VMNVRFNLVYVDLNYGRLHLDLIFWYIKQSHETVVLLSVNFDDSFESLLPELRVVINTSCLSQDTPAVFDVTFLTARVINVRNSFATDCRFFISLSFYRCNIRYQFFPHIINQLILAFISGCETHIRQEEDRHG